jgi:hypothetical protein
MTNKSNLEVKQDGMIVLHNVNASWPKLAKPDGIEGTPEEDKKYSIQALLRINDATFQDFKKAIAAKLPKDFGKPSPDKLPWREVNEKLPEAWGEVSAYRVTMKSKTQPKVFDGKGVQISPESVRAGDLVSIAFNVWPVSNKFGSFIQLQLQAVLRIKEDLDFGGTGPNVDAGVFGLSANPFQGNTKTDEFNDDIGF